MSGPIVQVNTGAFNQSLTAHATLSGVASGNALIALVSHICFDSAGAAVTVSDGSGSYASDSNNADGFGDTRSLIARRSSVSAGSYTATATAGSGAAGSSYGAITLIEVSGLVASPFDKQAGNGNFSTTPATSPTSTLSQANELLLAVLAIYQTTVTGLTFPPIGGPGTFTPIYSAAPDGESYSDCDYQVQSSGTAAVNVAWGTASSNKVWSCSVATYKMAAASAVEFRRTLSGIGGRVGSRQIQNAIAYAYSKRRKIFLPARLAA